jgi:hypothetical protein
VTVENILATVVNLVLGAALASGYRYAVHYWRVRRPAARIWTHARTTPFHIVTAQDDTDPDSEYTPKVYPAEYAAALSTRTLLVQKLKVPDVRVWTSDRFPTANILENLVCIGGPVHNQVTRRTLDRLAIPLEFVGYDLVSHVSGKTYEAKIDHATQRITRDVGVVIVTRNPRRQADPDACVILLMGARTFGCEGAACFITSGDLAAANEALGPGDLRWAILDVDVDDDFVAGVEILEASGQVPAPRSP